ncbi:MAG: cytochrome C [Firmicutes bacterium]|nr:cytochrome C [Bacillota bacterium]
MRKVGLISFLTLMAVVCLGATVLGAGAHDYVGCTGCHNIHYAVAEKAFGVDNTQTTNPRDGKLDGVSALCLGCHQTPENGGQGFMPIFLTTTHPVGVVPNEKIAHLSDHLLVNGVLECTSCHEPHPSNPNYKYLRVATDEGAAMDKFCALCHPAKVDLMGNYGLGQEQLPVFSSMNEAAGAGEFTQDEVIIHNETPKYIVPQATE